MTTSISNGENRPQTSPNFWTAPVAAGGAYPIVYPLFKMKTNLQRGNHCLEKVISLQTVKEGGKSAGLVSGIVGTQMILNDLISKKISRNENDIPGNLATATLVGAGTSYPLSALNKITAGIPVTEAMKNFKRTELKNITGRETAFFAGVNMSGPVKQELQGYFGESPLTERTSNFISGALGTAAGHINDTFLTRAQNGLKNSIRDAGRGILPRTIGGGLFCALYKEGKEHLKNNSE